MTVRVGDAPMGKEPSEVSHAIFDFDGTLSWLRHGWPLLMLDTCLHHAPVHWRQDSSLCRVLLDEILAGNGKPSINQIQAFCRRLEGGEIATRAQQILGEYTGALKSVLEGRLLASRNDPEAFLICGARDFLREFQGRGIKMFIVSGTVLTDVENEAKVLRLAEYFEGGIYGSPPNGVFSKIEVINRLMERESINGKRLVIFGDGPVEIACGKAVGAFTVGVASDEEVHASHRVDPIKRDHLIAAGADLIVADYGDRSGLLRQIFGDEGSSTGPVPRSRPPAG